MMIREAGIMHQGCPIIFTSYHRASKEDVNLLYTSGLMSGLLTFAETLMEPIEYFETDKYSIIFKKGLFKGKFKDDQKIVAFIVIDKDQRLEKYLKRTILPLLEKVLNKFSSQFSGCNLTKVRQFEVFKETINKLFGTGTQTFEEKVASLLA